MQGIQFVTDDKGKKIAVQINLNKCGEIWEDFFDNCFQNNVQMNQGNPLILSRNG